MVWFVDDDAELLDDNEWDDDKTCFCSFLRSQRGITLDLTERLASLKDVASKVSYSTAASAREVVLQGIQIDIKKGESNDVK